MTHVLPLLKPKIIPNTERTLGLNHLHSFIKLHLGASGPEPADAEALRMELADLQHKCNLLMEENKDLRNRVS